MSAEFASALEPLAVELHGALRLLDGRKGAVESAQEKLAELEERFGELRSADEGPLAVAFAALRTALSERAERATASKAALGAAYDDLAQALRDHSVQVPRLRPTNYKRNFFHALNGAIALVVILWAPSLMVYMAGAFLLSGLLMETTRRLSPAINEKLMEAFAQVAHPHERTQINSATWYALALFSLALTNNPVLCAVAVAALGFGDPAAAIVGRRFGRIKLVNGRSLEGTLAFIVVSGTIAFAAMTVAIPGAALGTQALTALVGVTAGAIAELFASRVDDNLAIPLASSLSLLALGLA